MKNNLKIKSPSKKEVEHYLEEWKLLEDYRLQESSLRKLFTKTYPFNTDLDDVLVKVCTLNQFYSTQIRKIFDLAKYIVSLNIDNDLKNNNLDLVEKIAKNHGIFKKKKDGTKGKELYLYSFATKYCSHHNPEIYPIYDSFVEKMLIHCKRDDFDFNNKDLKVYPLFRDILVNFRKFYDLESFDLKQIDKYLWQAGKKYFPKKY